MAKKSFGKQTEQVVSGKSPKEQPSVEDEPTEPAPIEDEPEKFRTTIMMSEDAIDLVSAIQRKYRRQNKERITKGEVYEMAIKKLAEEFNIKM